METTLKKKILVVEDDEFYVNVYKLKLDKEGYEVAVAKDGAEVAQVATKESPDLILLDLIMPNKDGFEALKELKQDPKLKDIKVIVVSNLGQEEDIKKAMELGAADYLVKTKMSIQEVVSKVKSHLGE